MQQASWRRAEFIVSPNSLAPLTATLESPHEARVDWRVWHALYGTGAPLLLQDQPELAALLSGCWAWNAGKPPGDLGVLVRQVQLKQLRSALPWAARALGLPPLDGAGR